MNILICRIVMETQSPEICYTVILVLFWESNLKNSDPLWSETLCVVKFSMDD